MSFKCYYCGINLDSSTPLNTFTKEHVPPQILYSKVRSQFPEELQMPNVPSCPNHNTFKCEDPNLDQKVIGNMLYDLAIRMKDGIALPQLVMDLINNHPKTFESTKRSRSDVPVQNSPITLTRVDLPYRVVEEWVRMLLAAILTKAAGEESLPSECWSDALILCPWITVDEEETKEVDRKTIVNERAEKIYELERRFTWIQGSGVYSKFPSELFSVTYAVNEQWELFVNIRIFNEFASLCSVRGLSRDQVARIVGWS